MDELQADVAIVGYGPVGRLLAITLAEKGHRVVVVERQKTSYPLPRAVCMDHEIRRALHAHGCADDIETFSAPSPRYQWFGQDWRTLLDIDWTIESISGGPEAHFFYQPALEAAMAKRVAQLPGITVLTDQEALGFHQDDRSVRLDIEDRSDGRRRQVQAKFLVGADGANSVVRKQLGIDWDDFGFNADFLVVDVALNEGVTLDIPSAGQFCHPQRPTTFVPGGIKDGRAVRRWEFMRMPDEPRELLEDKRHVWGLLERWVRPDQGEFLRHAVYTFRSLVAREWRNGRAFLAGDAAHLTPPFLGQGMCSGLRDAINLGWRLDLVLGGASAASALDAYEIERKPHITQLIEIAMYLGKIICVADPQDAAARDRSFHDGTAPPPAPFPHLQRGSLADDSPLAGRLSPHATVEFRGARMRLDDLTGSSFVLVARNSTCADRFGPALTTLLERLNAGVVYLAPLGESDERAVVDVTGKLERFMDENAIDAYLARPDGYIFGSVPHGASFCGLADALDAALPPAGSSSLPPTIAAPASPASASTLSRQPS